MYVEENVGESYREWEPGTPVKIMAPTGTGKSHFILHVLLDYAVSMGRKILYLVNRKILKRQLEVELEEKIAFRLREKYGVRWKNFIWVKTYQEVESEIKLNNNQIISFAPTYIVYDECHYFYADSDFNTNTVISYVFLRNIRGTIQIFMSATMENMLNKINPGGTNTSNNIFQAPAFIRNTNKYELPVDYSYVQLHCIDDENDIPTIIEEKAELGEKWLIFIDSIEKGKRIYKELCDCAICQKDEIVFIDATYERDMEAKESVEELEVTHSINKKIIITTSVMDNGVSFKDQGLRNLLIMADSKEEFIQMLGRKRQDGKEVNVYICRRNKAYFEDRKKYMNRTNHYLETYGNQIEQMWQCIWSGQRIHPECVFMQQKILDDAFNREVVYKHIRKFCYFQNGMIAINPFSVDKIMNTRAFYQEMIEAMRSDPDAFVKQQAKWLEIPDEKVEKVILDSEEKKCDRMKEQISKYLEELIKDKEFIELTSEMNREKLKKENKDVFLYFLGRANKDEDRENEIKDLKKTDRAIQANAFNSCMTEAALPYFMRKEGQKFIIERRKR